MSDIKKGVRLEGVSKIYLDPKTNKPFKAVDNINVNIEPGDFVTLLGPSGCGKTTTLRMIAGFESPDEGEIYLGDDAINALTPNKRDTAMVFQSYALFPHMNIYDNVAYGLKLRKVPRNEIQKRVFDMLKLVGLEGKENRYTNQLSGGQQQRVALARALVVEPGVLLFDEPLSNLDAKLRVYMRTEIRRIQQQFGITAVYVTHDQSEAMSISDRIIIMDKGHIAQMGTPRQIYYKPANKFVADFIGDANFLDITVNAVYNESITAEWGGIRFEAAKPETEIAVGDKATLMLRPEGIRLAETGILPCKVTLSCFMGSYQNYHVQVGDTEIRLMDNHPVGRRVFEVGDEAYLDFSSIDTHVMPYTAEVLDEQ